jgi:hypothetical protein
MGKPPPPSVRLFDGDFSLSLSELREAEAEIVQALELDPPAAYKRALTDLLVVARDLISHQAN